jgi:7-cyano-7-deazaguanine reductase
MATPSNIHAGPLGESTQYQDGYDATHLHPMVRAEGRAAVGLTDAMVFGGEDQWTAYEFSWLDQKGKPRVAELDITVPADSPKIVESKSMKLYLNGFSQTQFVSEQALQSTLAKDLSAGFGAEVALALRPVDQAADFSALAGLCLDELDIDIDVYDYRPDFLSCTDTKPADTQRFYSHLFRSLCPVTSQPDWATVVIECEGQALEPEGLLRYLVSYRNHQAFHESTIERIYADIWQRCKPQRLSVYGRFLRRGGIDINPFRSSQVGAAPRIRIPRQ